MKAFYSNALKHIVQPAGVLHLGQRMVAARKRVLWAGRWLLGILLCLALLLGGYRLYQFYSAPNQLRNQGLIIAGNDTTYAKSLAESYQLLVKRYVVPVSPKRLFQSALTAMQLVEDHWLVAEQRMDEEAAAQISQLEDAALGKASKDTEEAAGEELAEELMTSRAPKRRELPEAVKSRQDRQFAQELEQFPPAELKRRYQGFLQQSRSGGYYTHEFAKILYTQAMAALCRPLGDPFSGFFQDSGFYQLSDTTKGSFGGVGLYIDKQPNYGDEGIGESTSSTRTARSSAEQYQFLQQHYVKVSHPVPSGPSFRAGILADDFIYAVDDQSAKDWSVEQVQNTVRGQPGSKVKITVLRARQHEISFEVVREKIAIPAVKSAKIPLAAPIGKDLAYIRLLQFNALAAQQFARHIELLRKDDIAALVLDLRNNPGGLLNIAIDIVDQFLAAGVIVSTDARTEDNVVVFHARSKTAIPQDLPVFVLIDGESASAAEIVAGALQDHKRAELIGEKSFGKGSVQVPVTLPEGILKITIAHYYTPNGMNLANNGIQPDFAIEVPQLSEAERLVLLEIYQENLIDNFVSQNPEYTEKEFDKFFRSEISSYNIPINIIKKVAYNEKVRFMEEIPIYNLEYDFVLRKAVDYISKKIL